MDDDDDNADREERFLLYVSRFWFDECNLSQIDKETAKSALNNLYKSCSLSIESCEHLKEAKLDGLIYILLPNVLYWIALSTLMITDIGIGIMVNDK